MILELLKPNVLTPWLLGMGEPESETSVDAFAAPGSEDEAHICVDILADNGAGAADLQSRAGRSVREPGQRRGPGAAA